MAFAQPSQTRCGIMPSISVGIALLMVVLLLLEGLHFNGKDRRQVADDRVPRVAAVGGAVDLAAGGAEVDAAVVEAVDGHGVAEDVDVAVGLREALCQR